MKSFAVKIFNSRNVYGSLMFMSAFSAWNNLPLSGILFGSALTFWGYSKQKWK